MKNVCSSAHKTLAADGTHGRSIKYNDSIKMKHGHKLEKKKKHKMSVHKVDTSSSRKTPQYSAVNSFQTRFSVRL